jgi:predicted N-acyltransferase
MNATPRGIAEFDAREWNALNTAAAPFLRHEFLATLEQTGCVGAATGWLPAPIVIRDAKGIAAAAPAYLKSHSYGEFVFDFSWAQAYARFGLSYYPKLVIGVPFTPATGPRLLVRPGLDVVVMKAQLIAQIVETAQQHGCSSVHALFADQTDRDCFERAGWLARRDVQFHWSNRGYADYDDYLAAFTAEKRKKAKRERRRVTEAGIEFRTLVGDEIDRGTIDAVYDLHRDTFLRHGHEPYLNREFVRAAPALLGSQFMVKLAQFQGEPVATAVFFRSNDSLYGRYWGAVDRFHSLHFETCYHQGIDFCIAEGLQKFEPGTQGEHKVSRGFEPTLTGSAHWIVEPRFRTAIADYLRREATHVDEYAEQIRAHTPFRA